MAEIEQVIFFARGQSTMPCYKKIEQEHFITTAGLSGIIHIMILLLLLLNTLILAILDYAVISIEIL